MRTTVLFGPPGTGKTTELLNVVQEQIAQGVEPSQIAYFGFTRKSANEAVDRAIEKFGGTRSDYPWFRTLHSAAFRLLGLRRSEVLQTRHYRELGQHLGIDFQFEYDESSERVPVGGGIGDNCLRIYALARAMEAPVEDVLRREYDTNRLVTLEQVNTFVQALETYKREFHLLDFSDMIDDCRSELPVKHFIVDEAQDLTSQQWALARRLGRNAEKVLLAGDDDQAIFEWSGASPNRLQNIQGHRFVLPKSHRLPEAIWSLTQKVSARIGKRYAKEWTHNGNRGLVVWTNREEDIDLSTGSWLLLSRHINDTRRLVAIVRSLGYVYRHGGRWSNESPESRAVLDYERLRRGDGVSVDGLHQTISFVAGASARRSLSGVAYWSDVTWPWDGDTRPSWLEAMTKLSDEDREYIRALRANNESMTKPGRIEISTIHGAKGGEADNVLLLTKANRRVRREALVAPDPELRVWYVAVSRARKCLYLLEHEENTSFFNFLGLPQL